MSKIFMVLIILFTFAPFQSRLNAAENDSGKYICQTVGANNWLFELYGIQFLLVDFNLGHVAFGNDQKWLPKENAAIKKIAIGYKVSWKQRLKRLASNKEVVRNFSARMDEQRNLQLFYHCKGAGCGSYEVSMACKPL